VRHPCGGHRRPDGHPGASRPSPQFHNRELISSQEVKVGLAADIGTLQRLPKVVGNGSKARELALTGRQFGAQEAKDFGFVSDVIPGGRKEVIGELL